MHVIISLHTNDNKFSKTLRYVCGCFGECSVIFVYLYILCVSSIRLRKITAFLNEWVTMNLIDPGNTHLSYMYTIPVSA